MISRYPELSEWSITETNISQHRFSFSKTCRNDTNPSNTHFMHENRYNTEDDQTTKLLKHCTRLSPLLQGLILSTLTSGLVLAVVISLWLTSASTTSTTTQMITSNTTTTIPYICGSSCVNQSWISSSNLLAKWNFDNNLLNNVTDSNASSVYNPTFVTGYVNQALSLNADPTQLITSSSINLENISFTIDAWIYPTGFPNTRDHIIVASCYATTIDECLHVSIRKIGSNFNLYFGFYSDDCQGSTNVSINEWIHVAFVFDSNTLKQSIYLNGILDAIRVATGPFQGNSSNITIGNIPNIGVFVGNNSFDGMIDQLTITGRAKSTCEILEDATLAAYFSFNSGVQLMDSGPNSLAANEQSVSFVSTGHSLQAISFNGASSSYFQASGLTGLGITNRAFSISLWIRPQILSGILVHVSSTSSGVGWCIPFLGFTTNGSIVAQMYNGGVVVSAVGPIIPLAPNWSHIVETWSSTNGLRLYVNNVLVASVTISIYTASSTPNYVTLANSLSGINTCLRGLLGSMAPYNGDIDEFSVYSRALTADDICLLYVS